MSFGSTAIRSIQLGRLGVDVLRATRRPPGPGRDAARRLLSARLGHLRGLPQKIGQIISLSEFDDENPVFTPLTDAADPVPADEAFTWIARELRSPLSQVFRSLDRHGAAASLGQVHRGELLDGRAVAVKIQFPAVQDSLSADLSALGWLSAPLSAHRSGFDLGGYRAEMRRSLLQELDYRHEALTLQRFASRATAVPGLITPTPYGTWCTPRLITMSWVEGDPIQTAARWPAAARQDAALALLRFFLRCCFTWRELHADPHAGNIRFRRAADATHIGILDFGCVRTLRADESVQLGRLARDGGALSASELVDTYVALGFNPDLLLPMCGRLQAVTSILFEPFHAVGPYDLRTWHLGSRLAAALGEDRWNFRFAGPPSLLFLIRAFQGLVQHMTTLGAVLDWRRELLALLPNGMGTRLPPPLPAPHALTDGDNLMAATTLRLRVTRADEPVVQLSFQAAAASNLPFLVPEEYSGRIRARGIDLARLAAQTAAAGYPPGDLFTLTEGERTVRVWLE